MQKARLVDIPPAARGSQFRNAQNHWLTVHEDPIIQITAQDRPRSSPRDTSRLSPLVMGRPVTSQFAPSTEIRRKRVPSEQLQPERRSPRPDSSIEALMQLEENLEYARMQQENIRSSVATSYYGEERAAASIQVPRSRYSRPDLCPGPLTTKRKTNEETIHFTINEVSSTIFELKSPTASVAPSRRTRSSFAPSVGGRSTYSRRDEFEERELPDLPEVPELPPIGTWKLAPGPIPPRRPLGTFHESHSSPELSQASRRATMKTLTHSQIFDPQYPIFSKPSFERLSLAFMKDRRASKLALAEDVASPTNSDDTLHNFYEQEQFRPRSATAVSFLTEQDTLTDEPQQGKSLAAIIQELKESLKWGNHAPCTTPNGQPSPLPLCARPDGVDEFLTKMKDRSKRVWRWRWKSKRRVQAPYHV